MTDFAAKKQLLQTKISRGYSGKMPYSVQILGNKGQSVEIEGVPDYCPVCRNFVEPISTAVAIQTDDYLNPVVEVVFRCPRNKCGRLYIARYAQRHDWAGATSFYLFECVPFTLQKPTFTESITEVSPNFVEIYQQASHAEAYKLDLVCGPGYRKALEFLIKDYVSGLHPTDADRIKKLYLAACIEEFVSDPKIKEISRRAAWLGNDETHYLRIWTQKDIQDLKRLILLTVHWIDAEELTKKAIAEMPDPKKAGGA